MDFGDSTVAVPITRLQKEQESWSICGYCKREKIDCVWQSPLHKTQPSDHSKYWLFRLFCHRSLSAISVRVHHIVGGVHIVSVGGQSVTHRSGHKAFAFKKTWNHPHVGRSAREYRGCPSMLLCPCQLPSAPWHHHHDYGSCFTKPRPFTFLPPSMPMTFLKPHISNGPGKVESRHDGVSGSLHAWTIFISCI